MTHNFVGNSNTNIPLDIFIDVYFPDQTDNPKGRIEIDKRNFQSTLWDEHGIRFLDIDVVLWKHKDTGDDIRLNITQMPAQAPSLEVIDQITHDFFASSPWIHPDYVVVTNPEISITGWAGFWLFKWPVCQWRGSIGKNDAVSPEITSLKVGNDPVGSAVRSMKNETTGLETPIITRGLFQDNTISFDAEDNVLLFRVDLFVDGEKLRSWENTGQGSFTYTWTPGEGDHHVLIEAEDAYNNKTRSGFILRVNNASSFAPDVIIVDPDGTDDAEQEYYIIRYQYTDRDSTGTVSFYFDPDGGKNENTPEGDFAGYIGTDKYFDYIIYRQDTYVWDLHAEGSGSVPPGFYYVYARITDGVNTKTVRSPGRMEVEAIPVEDNLDILEVRVREVEGDGDLIPDPGERIEVKLKIRNKSNKTLQNIEGFVMRDALTAAGTDVVDDMVPLGELGPGETHDFSSNLYLDHQFIVYPLSYKGVFAYGVHFRYRDINWKAIDEYDTVACTYMDASSEPKFEITEISVDEDDDGDGVIESGEDVKFKVKMRNSGNAMARNIEGQFSPISGMEMMDDIEDFPDLAPGNSAWSDGVYRLYNIPKNLSGWVDLSLNVTHGDDGLLSMTAPTFSIFVSTTPYIKLTPRDLNFGVRNPSSGPVDIPLVIENSGSATLNISNIVASHPSDTQIIGSINSLPPGESGSVTIRINIANMVGEIVRTVTVMSDAHSPANNVLTIGGTVSNLPSRMSLGIGIKPDVYDNYVVWSNNGEIMIYDLMKNNQMTVSMSDSTFRDPKIHEYGGNHLVVFEDASSDDIWLYNIETTELRVICSDLSEQRDPQIWGRYIVWKDARNITDGRFDLYGYDLETGVEFLIESSSQDPSYDILDFALHNGMVVWHKQRVSTSTTHHLITKVLPNGSRYEKLLGPSYPTTAQKLSFYGNEVIFEAGDSEGERQLWKYNTVSHAISQLTTFEDSHTESDLWGCTVVWEDRRQSTRTIYSMNVCTPNGELPLVVDTNNNLYEPAIWENLVAVRSQDGNIYVLSLCGQDISVDLETPGSGLREGQIITLNGMVSNVGPASLNNVPLTFYLGDPNTGGSPINPSQQVSLSPGQSSQVSTAWSIPGPGSYSICLLAELGCDFNGLKDCIIVEVQDNDTSEPVISNVNIEEFVGDGDGSIDVGEQVRISWTAADSGSGICGVYFNLGGIDLPVLGNYHIITNSLVEGLVNYTITVEDCASYPNIVQDHREFSVAKQPAIQSINPCGQTGVLPSTTLEILFVTDMLSSTINTGTILLERNGSAIPLQIDFVPTERKVIITPDSLLESNQNYKVRILSGPSGVGAERGGWWPGGDYECTFTTGLCSVIDIPTLISPVYGIETSTTPALDWGDIPGALSYDLEICNDIACSSVERSENIIGKSQLSVSPALIQGTTYWWRVRARNACGYSDWSITYSFSTIADLLTLTVTKAGSGSGTIAAQGLTCTGNTCTGTFPFNATVDITPTLGAGSYFVGWTGCSSVNAGVCKVTMNGNINVTAYFTSGPLAYVASGSQYIHVIDTGGNAKVFDIDIGGTSYDIAVSPDGSKVYVAQDSTDRVIVIDTASHTVTDSIDVGDSPTGIALSHDGSKVYVANYWTHDVSVINTSSHEVVSTIPVGEHPFALAVNPTDTRLYVSNHSGDSVSVINMTTNSVIVTITVGNDPYGVVVSPSGTTVYIANYLSDNVSTIDAASHAVSHPVSLVEESRPVGIAINPEGTRLYVTSHQTNNVSVFNVANDFAKITDISVGTNPHGITFNRDLSRIYVANYTSNTISVINALTNAVDYTITGIAHPIAISKPVQQSKAHHDFDHDGRTDIAVWRPSDGTWYIIRSSDGTAVQIQWGTGTAFAESDIPVPGDYDGDTRTDIAVWRPSDGTWYIIRSSDDNVVQTQWGTTGDIPVPGDYDGDTRTDIAVWRPSDGTWYIIRSSDGTAVQIQWGTGTAFAESDIPVPGDYDGDHSTDIAVWRPSDGTWYIIRSSDQTAVQIQWGTGTAFAESDIPVPGDYDGDTRTDLAIWRPSDGTWYIIRSSDDNVVQTQWGTTGDIPVPGDYDGDHSTDIAVWRPTDGTWYIIRSSDGTVAQITWGTAGDMPIGK